MSRNIAPPSLQRSPSLPDSIRATATIDPDAGGSVSDTVRLGAPQAINSNHAVILKAPRGPLTPPAKLDVPLLEGITALIVVFIAAMRRREWPTVETAAESFFAGMKLFSGLLLLTTGLLPELVGLDADVAASHHEFRISLVLAGLIMFCAGTNSLLRISISKGRETSSASAPE